MNNSSKQSELKKRALLAKKRMAVGFWQNVNEEKVKNEERCGDNVQAKYVVRSTQRAMISRDISNRLAGESVRVEEKMYEKVCTILESNEIITNPISMLMDKRKYDDMDVVNRQKYILDISKKYCELKERYYKEHNAKYGS